MKLLCLSDLHLRSQAVVAAIDRQRLSPFPRQIAATVAEVSPDAVVVPGNTVCLRQARLISAISKVLDTINSKYGRGTIFPLAEGVKKPWQMRRDMLTPNYTTSWSQIPLVK